MTMYTGVGNLNKHGSEYAGLKTFVKAAILLGLGFYFASMVFNDTVKNYSNQPEWLSLGAAGLFALLGVASIASFLVGRTKKQEMHYHTETEEHHDHAHFSMPTETRVEGHSH